MTIWKGRSNPHAVYQPVTLPPLHVGPTNFSPPHMPTGHTDTLRVLCIRESGAARTLWEREVYMECVWCMVYRVCVWVHEVCVVYYAECV